MAQKTMVHIVRLIFDHSTTTVLILSFSVDWQSSQVISFPREVSADSIAPAEISALEFHAKDAEARTHALDTLFWSVKSHCGVGVCGTGGAKRIRLSASIRP